MYVWNMEKIVEANLKKMRMQKKMESGKAFKYYADEKLAVKQAYQQLVNNKVMA